MSKAWILLPALIVLLVVPVKVYAQASKALEERTKSLQQGEQKSWQQVDEINKETDKTKGRYQQAQKAGAQPSKPTGYTVKKRSITTGNAARKVPPAKPKVAPGKKK